MARAGVDACDRGAGAADARGNALAARARRRPSVHRRRGRLGRSAGGRRRGAARSRSRRIRSWSASATSCRRSRRSVSCMRPAFRRGIALLERFGLAYDILIYARQLPAAIEFASRVSGGSGSCSIISASRTSAAASFDAWRRDLRRLAALPNVCAKLSGLVTEADWQRWTPAAAPAVSRRRVRVLRRRSADDRLGLAGLHGGGDLRATMDVVTRRRSSGRLGDEREAVLGGTAQRFWNLSDVRSDCDEAIGMTRSDRCAALLAAAAACGGGEQPRAGDVGADDRRHPERHVARVLAEHPRRRRTRPAKELGVDDHLARAAARGRSRLAGLGGRRLRQPRRLGHRAGAARRSGAGRAGRRTRRAARSRS